VHVVASEGGGIGVGESHEGEIFVGDIIWVVGR